MTTTMTNINSDVINRNVQKVIDSLNAEDLDVEKIMEYDEGSSDELRDVSAKKKILRCK